MGPEVTLLPEAVRELYDQAEYYEGRGSSETAGRWIDQVRATFRFLAQNPGIGTAWPVPEGYCPRIPESPISANRPYIRWTLARARERGDSCALHVAEPCAPRTPSVPSCIS